MSRSISSHDDIIDSRDVIERLDELQNMDNRDDAEQGELEALEALQDDAEGYAPDWNYGATLIRDSYFKEYAQELAEDVGAYNGGENWPLNCIDWDQAARELQMDYTSVEFDGIDYWVR